LKRNKSIKKQHELDNINERIENVKGSISVDFDVSNKNILVFDNTSTTGLSFEEIQIELKSKGANKIIFFCIGLGLKHKEFDFDINSNTILKATHIIENWHWPKSDRKNSKSN
jgi:phosphoribosylpyrophosphate synthetase